jgi:hypothetical protein
MFAVELYSKIRLAVMVDGLSRREAAKRFGVHRNKIFSSARLPPARRSWGLIWRGSTPFLKATAAFTRSSGTRRTS